MSETFQTFEEFWPYYLREHSDPLNRKLHIAGTTAGILFAAWSVLRGKPHRVLYAPLFGYGPAWIGHFIIEKNRPATFTHPLWSFRGDLRMTKLAWTGGLNKELARAGVVDAEIIDVGE